jgi:hypothetical protein
VDRIERPMWEPHHCCFTLKHEDPEGFYPGQFINGRDPRAVIAVSHVRTLARDLGYVHPDEHQAVLEQKAELEDQINAMQSEMDHMHRQVEAIDLLQSAGYVARKKPGRPPKQPEEAAA